MTIMAARYQPSDRASAVAGGATFAGVAHPDEHRWIEAGLLDPSSVGADHRRDLLTWLTEQDIDIDELVDACRHGQLGSIAGDRALRPGPRLTPRELSEQVGVDLQLVHDVRRASGFPAVADDESSLSADDVQVFGVFQSAASFFSRDEVLRLATVMGSSMRRIADAAGEMFLRDVEAPMKSTGPDELQLAQANLFAIGLARAATDVFAPMFLTHLEVSIQRLRQARRDSEDYETLPLAIGFVDLSGFTERSGTLSPHELRDLVVDFEMRANGIVGDHDGRVVKLIGDEVMFSALDANAACSIALALTAAAPPGTRARGGVAFGRVVASGGDLYGPVVNLASRIADIAIPGEVLVNEAVAEQGTDWRFEPAGRRSLKGFGEPVRVWTLLG
jgi:adenylate cyclase